MTHHDDLDQMLTAWLDDPFTPPAPAYLGLVLERTRRTRQRPAWANLERWLPMASELTGRTASPPRIAWLLIIGLLVVALVAAVAVVGSRLLPSKVAIPQGGAAVLVFSSWVGDSSGQTDGDIFTVRADGTDLRQLTKGPGVESKATFSPDGTRIAYRVWQNGTDSIMVMSAGGGQSTTLATNPAAESYCASRGGLAWSPDGSALIFPANAACDSGADLFIAPSDGSSPATKLLASGTTGDAAEWSPDGTRIAFLGSESGGSVGTYVADVGAGGGRSGGLQARRVAAGASGPRWSPDGTQLVSTNDSGGVLIVRPDGSGQRVVVEPGAGAEPIWAPTWSPNGQQLAYYQGVDPAERLNDRPCTVRTWVVDADGTDKRRLEPIGDGCDLPVSWSPDGTRLAVLLIDMADPNHPYDLSMITLDGSHPMVTLGDTTSGSWQPVVAPLPPAPSFPASAAP